MNSFFAKHILKKLANQLEPILDQTDELIKMTTRHNIYIGLVYKSIYRRRMAIPLTNFQAELKQFYNKLKYPQDEYLQYHQYVVQKYLINNPNQRGLLLMHQTGLGKTILAIALADVFQQHDPNRRVIVLAAKSLMGNFKKNITKYKSHSTDASTTLDTSWKYVSLNAGNMFNQLESVHKSDMEVQFDKELGKLNLLTAKGFLENSLLIVDEAHNLFNAIANGSKNGIAFYDEVLNTRNIKILFLSGTPLVNSPFELVPCFNMLRGLVLSDNGRLVTLFPENKMEFNNYFVDDKQMQLKNKSLFQNRIVGLISYYGELYTGKQRKGFPEQLQTKLEIVHMSQEQYGAYSTYRERELQEAARPTAQSSSDRFNVKSTTYSSYRIKSRQACNLLIRPDEANRQPGIKEIKTELSKLSPKMKMILHNTKKHNGIGVIYSEFVQRAGVFMFAKILQSNGYQDWIQLNAQYKDMDMYATKTNNKAIVGGDSRNKTRMYAIITGQTPIEEREQIIDVFNAENNINGSSIHLLIISRAGAEGIDLKNVRHIHIMEPFWNMARIEQIIARAVRYKSHDQLPSKDRTVQPYIYLSDYPAKMDPKKIQEPTTDIDLFMTANKNKALIENFIHGMVEASIDCHAHANTEEISKRIHCKLCMPTEQPIYNPLIARDFELPNPCIKPDKYTIQANEIEYNGDNYYYTLKKVDTIMPQVTIYKYDKSIDMYVVMNKSHPQHSSIVKAVLGLEL